LHVLGREKAARALDYGIVCIDEKNLSVASGGSRDVMVASRRSPVSVGLRAASVVNL